MAKEFVPIVLNIAVWALYLKETSIFLQSDHLSLVTAINKGSCRDVAVVYLLRCTYVVFVFNIEIVAKHLPGIDNLVADKLSRNSTDQMFLSYLPTPLRFSIVWMISPKGFDWLSPHFHTILLVRI